MTYKVGIDVGGTFTDFLLMDRRGRTSVHKELSTPVDPSLAVAALGTRPERLVREVDTLGLLFESLVVRDLRVYSQAMDADVFHYRDNTGLEADAVVQRRDGRWGAFEVRLGLSAIDDAAAALIRLAARVDVDRHGAPVVLAVITGWGYGYQRPDGVSVIPIGTLAP